MTFGCDTLIIGGGITGLTIARELVKNGNGDIVILEKEPALGRHASGRNSGVLHAGIYYLPDSLKARFCIDGNRLMKQFCKEKGLTLRETGKVIVTKNESEWDALDELKRRADSSGATVVSIDRGQLAEIEPHAATCEKALYSPATAVIRPKEILKALADELTGAGKVRILYDTACLGFRDRQTAVTADGVYSFRRMVNAAGTYADRIAQAMGLGLEYRILPFKGTYKRLVKERSHLVRGNIYPVPDLRNPFLGVHLTKTADGEVSVGPTAIPAFGRENYHLLDGWGLETASIACRNLLLLFTNPAYRAAARSEPKKYLKHFIHKEAKALVPELRPEDLENSPKVGIRPQLVHWPTRSLVTDFVVIEEESGIHILNAISPAFTSSMAFAQYIVSRMSGERRSDHVVSV